MNAARKMGGYAARAPREEAGRGCRGKAWTSRYQQFSLLTMHLALSRPSRRGGWTELKIFLTRSLEHEYA